MNEAEQLLEAPNAAVQKAQGEATTASAEADSLYASFFRHDDDSVLIVSAWRGSEPLTRTYESSEEIPSDLAFDHSPEEAAVGLAEAEAVAAEIASGEAV